MSFCVLQGVMSLASWCCTPQLCHNLRIFVTHHCCKATLCSRLINLCHFYHVDHDSQRGMPLVTSSWRIIVPCEVCTELATTDVTCDRMETKSPIYGVSQFCPCMNNFVNSCSLLHSVMCRDILHNATVPEWCDGSLSNWGKCLRMNFCLAILNLTFVNVFWMSSVIALFISNCQITFTSNDLTTFLHVKNDYMNKSSRDSYKLAHTLDFQKSVVTRLDLHLLLYFALSSLSFLQKTLKWSPHNYPHRIALILRCGILSWKRSDELKFVVINLCRMVAFYDTFSCLLWTFNQKHWLERNDWKDALPTHVGHMRHFFSCLSYVNSL